MKIFILLCLLVGVIIYFGNPEYWDDISNPDDDFNYDEDEK